MECLSAGWLLLLAARLLGAAQGNSASSPPHATQHLSQRCIPRVCPWMSHSVLKMKF